MRGPGNTPGAWGMELAVDELAERLGMDPLALRERIDLSPARPRGTPGRRSADRLVAPSCARGRGRSGQARDRDGAVVVGRQCPNHRLH